MVSFFVMLSSRHLMTPNLFSFPVAERRSLLINIIYLFYMSRWRHGGLYLFPFILNLNLYLIIVHSYFVETRWLFYLFFIVTLLCNFIRKLFSLLQLIFILDVLTLMYAIEYAICKPPEYLI